MLKYEKNTHFYQIIIISKITNIGHFRGIKGLDFEGLIASKKLLFSTHIHTNGIVYKKIK